MQSSSSSEDSGKERCGGSRGPHGRRYHRRHGHHEGHSQERDNWRKCREGRGEVSIGVAILCQDMNPYHQAVMVQLIKNAIRGGCKPQKEEFKKRHGASKERRKEFFTSEKVKEVANELLKDKDKIIESIELILEVLREERKKAMPAGEDVKQDKEGEGVTKRFGSEMHFRGNKRFAKEIADLITEWRHKGITDKEQQREIVKKTMGKMRRNRKKEMARGAKKMVRKILSYELDCSDPLYRRVVERVVTDAFVGHCHMKMFHRRKKMFEMMKEGKFEMPQEPKEGEEEKQERHGGRGGRHHRGRWGGRTREAWGGPMGHHMGPHMGGRGNKMFMRMMFQELMLKKGLKFVLGYYKKNAESIKTCFDVVKEVVEGCFKESEGTEEYKMRASGKVIAEIVSGALRAAGDKDSKEFYADYAKRYIKGCVTPCHKGLFKRCRKLVKSGLLLNGIKDKCVIGVASRWGAIACCQANGKAGCPEAVCAEFINKWIGQFTPIVIEAVAVANETAKELSKEPVEEQKGEKLLGKLTFGYLTMNCPDGKFDKEDFKKFMKGLKEKMDKEYESMKMKCKRKPEETQ